MITEKRKHFNAVNFPVSGNEVTFTPLEEAVCFIQKHRSKVVNICCGDSF
jgi:hypothetical protein